MNVKEGVLESCSSQDTELKLPDQVRFVRTGAFDKANEVRIVIGRQVRGIEGREKDGERHLSGKACVFPMLEPSDVLGEDAASLICGFCLYPDLYANSEGYLTALKSMREEVLSLAASLGILVSVNRCLRKNGIGLTQAEILGRVDWTDPFELARLAGRQNWEAKALYAEGAVLSLSPQELDQALRILGPVPFSAKALILAGCFRDKAVLKVLLDHGFSLQADSDLFWDLYLKLERDTDEASQDELIDHKISREYCFFCGGGYVEKREEYEKLKRWNPQLKESSVEVREENAMYLYSRREESRISSGELLFEAVGWGDSYFAEDLYARGMRALEPDQDPLENRHFDGIELICGKGGSHARENFLGTIRWLSTYDLLPALRLYCKFAEDNHKKMELTEEMLRLPAFQREDILAFVQKNCGFSLVNWKRLLTDLIDQEASSSIQFYLSHGCINRQAVLDQLLEHAAEKQKSSSVALLLSFRETFRKPQAREMREAYQRRLLEAAPDSSMVMAEVWSWEKKKDGSLLLREYRGSDPDVMIPARIGGKPSLELRKGMFSSLWSHPSEKITEFLREELHSVVLPEGLLKIPAELFRGCGNLSEVRIPETVIKIGKMAFESCGRLKELYVPPSVQTIGENAFGDPSLLSKEDLPELTGKEGSYVLRWCRKHGIPCKAEKDGSSD